MFSKSYFIPPLEVTLDYFALNYWLLDITCFSYATKVPCLVVKAVILILFKLRPRFCNFLLNQNFFLKKMPKTHGLTLEQRQEIITLKKEGYSSREIFLEIPRTTED